MSTVPTYFPDSLPINVPKYIDKQYVNDFQYMLNKIHERIKKLNEANTICKLESKDFAAAAKNMFDISTTQFDGMSRFAIVKAIGDMVDTSTTIKERVWFSTATPLFDTRFTTREEWEMLRCLGIGGSEVSIIQGLNPWQSEGDLKRRKHGFKDEVSSDKQGIFFRGHLYEPHVIEWFSKTTGWNVLPNYIMWQSKKYPSCNANIDAVIEKDGELSIFEAKTANIGMLSHWKEIIPAYYETQLRHYAAVLDCKDIKRLFIGAAFVADIQSNGIWLGAESDEKNNLHHVIMRDAVEEEKLLRDSDEWFNRVVVNNGEVKESEAEKEQKLKEKTLMLGSEKPEVAELDLTTLHPSWNQAIAECLAIEEEKKALEQSVKDIKAKYEASKSKIIGAIEKQSGLVNANFTLPDGNVFEARTQIAKKTSVEKEGLSQLLAILGELEGSMPEATRQRLLGCVTFDKPQKPSYRMRVKKAKKSKE